MAIRPMYEMTVIAKVVLKKTIKILVISVISLPIPYF